MTPSNKIPLDEVYAIADTLSQTMSYHGEALFNEIKMQTGIPKTKIRQIFKNRMTDSEIVRLLLLTPHDLILREKCTEIKRLALGLITQERILRALFKFVQEDLF